MLFVAALALFLPPAFAVGAALGKPFEEGAPLAALGTVAVGYLLALAGLLRALPWVMYAAFLVACGYLVYRLFIKKTLRLQKLFTLGFFAFLAMAVVLWWVCRGRMLVFWDDYSHWGLALKNTFYLDGLYTAPGSSVAYKAYPPASVVFPYAVLKAVRAPFREDLALFANGILLLSLAVYPLKAFGRKTAGAGVVCAALLFLLPAALNAQLFFRLLVDGLLGVLFAYILLSRFLPQVGRFSTLHAALGCFVLALLKDSGAGLALLAALVLLLEALLFERDGLKMRWRTGGRAAKTCVALRLFAPLLAVAAGYASWAVHKSIMGIGGVVAQHRTDTALLPGLAELFAGQAPAYRYEVVRGFFQNWFAVPQNSGIVPFPSVCWLLVFAAFLIATLALLQKSERGRYLFFAVSFIACYLVFMLSLLLGYLFAFSSGEAMMLASMTRYERTMVTACMLFFTAALLVAAAKQARLWARGVACAGAVAVALVFCDNAVLFTRSALRAPTEAAFTQHERYLSGHSADMVRALGEQNPRVHLVSINDDRFALMRLVYELVPVALADPDQITSIAADNYYGAPSPSTLVVSPREWGAMLADSYDYVYLYNIDGNFTTFYRELFEYEDDIVNDVMLEVVPHGDGSVTLRRLFTGADLSSA